MECDHVFLFFESKDTKGKPHPCSKESKDKGLSALWIKNLTSEEKASLEKIDFVTRQNIFSDISQVYAWTNPLSGYHLCEKIVDSVRRILQFRTVEEALMIPTEKRGRVKGFVPKTFEKELCRHPRRTYVEKIYQPIMEYLNKKADTGKRFYGQSCRGRMPRFRTIWRDYFLLYRDFIRACAVVTGSSVRSAVKYASVLGNHYLLTTNQMKNLIQEWDNGKRPDILSDEFEDEGDEEKVKRWTLMEEAHAAEQDEAWDVNEGLPLMLMKLAGKITAKKKSDAKQQRKKVAPTRAAKKVALKKVLPAKRKVKIVVGEDSTCCATAEEEASEQRKLPVFEPTAGPTDLPEEEWLILEIPYNGIQPRSLVGGMEFVPEGSGGTVMIVLAIFVESNFVYTMDRADIIYHGQVPLSEKICIQARCEEQRISFSHVYPNNHTWSGFGVHVSGNKSALYQQCFGELRLSVADVYHYLSGKHASVDEERGTLQKSIGVSTMNYEKHLKTTAELEGRFLDAPSWSGTEDDYKVLVPMVREVLDCIQDYVDALPLKEKVLNDMVRNRLFAARLNELTGCKRFRFDTFTVAVATLSPRSKTLLRHLDRRNDIRPGFTITAIWSSLFKMILQGEITIFRISVIAYTRKIAGNYTEKMCSYVPVVRDRVRRVLDHEFYTEANSYHNLDLAREFADNNFKRATVWVSDSEKHTIQCLVTSGYFDPCAYLSAFAWTIRKLIPHWSLDRTATVELIYLGSILSSSTPFVWLLSQWLEEPAINFLESKSRCMAERYYNEMKRRSGRQNPVGGYISRHQTSIVDWPGAIGLSDAVFTEDTVSAHLRDMEKINNVILELENELSHMNGERALDCLKSIRNLGPLCVLKVLPLSCLVGLCDVTKCFRDALHGELPADKPHTKELVRLGCSTKQQQQKFVEALNEWLGAPREYFFYGDHVLCVTESFLGSDKTKKEIFFPEQTLYRFFSNPNDRVVVVEQKIYGEKEWQLCSPGVW